MPLTFVVGTSRSGSTMLSRILHRHPDTLSVSEFFAMLMRVMHERVFWTAEIDGNKLWQMLTTPYDFFDEVLLDGIGFPELCYPYGNGRFTLAPANGMPMICHQTLPMLTDDPDALYDQLAAEVPTWPLRSAADQYRALFDHLAGILDRRVIVERSSTSLSVISLLRQQFPEARFVHIYRDGPDCALSMSRHPMYRMAGMRAEAVRLTGQSSWDDIEAELRRMSEDGELAEEFTGLLAPPFDAKRFMNYPLPAAFFGGMWSRMVAGGMTQLAELPPDIWTSVRYEDLIADPEKQLSRLAEFIGVSPTADWFAAARELTDTRAAGESGGLDPEQLAALQQACKPGMDAIVATEEGRLAAEGASS
jgi:hypothetical protein